MKKIKIYKVDLVEGKGMPSEKMVERHHSCSRGWRPGRRGWGWRRGGAPEGGRWRRGEQGRQSLGEMLPRPGLTASRDRRGESSGLQRPGLFSIGKKAALDESPSDDGLPNKQTNKPKKSVRVNFLPRKKTGKPMSFWAAKLALTSSYSYQPKLKVSSKPAYGANN
jgi:hypothetical protein